VRIVCCWNLSPSEVEKKIAEEFGSSGEGGPEAKLHDESSEKIVQYLDPEPEEAEMKKRVSEKRTAMLKQKSDDMKKKRVGRETLQDNPRCLAPPSGDSPRAPEMSQEIHRLVLGNDGN
jgi:hypothetical protein